jgi:amino acid permease
MLSWKQFGALPPGYLLYGLGFLLPILFTLINIKTIKTNKPFVLVFFAISFLVFFMIFFLIDEKKQAATIFELMESSFKRGMFYFLPTLIFYAATTPVTLRFSSWLERFRNQV